MVFNMFGRKDKSLRVISTGEDSEKSREISNMIGNGNQC